MTYLAHHGKVVDGKKTIEEKHNIVTETTIRMSLTLLGGIEKSELMDTLENRLTRPSEDTLFLRKEIIDALKGSDEKTTRIQSDHSSKG